MRRAFLMLFAVALLSLGLAACGGSDDSSTDTTATSTAQQTETSADANANGAQQGGGGASDKQAGEKGSTSQSPKSAGDGGQEKPASLATDPGSIRGARVTGTGAVQTLPPSEDAQTEAMENSYSSIKAFGEESEGSEATDITFGLVQYLDAKASGDWATACARLYSVLRDNLTKAAEGSKDPAVAAGGCPAAYGSLMSRQSQSDAAAAAKIDVASVRRGDGNRAFVIYKTPDTLSADMPMYLEDGVWTVGALEAYVLTPEQLRENQG